jgi:hypothetical protein
VLHHSIAIRERYRTLPIDKKEYYRLQKNNYMKGYYERNRQHILEYHKEYYRKKRKQKRLKERTRSNN